MKWKIALFLFLALIMTANWIHHYRSDTLYDRIINQNGYALSLIEEGITTRFTLQPEWIPDQEGETTQLGRAVEEIHGTTVILEKVQKREADFYLTLQLASTLDRTSGYLISPYRITEPGRVSTGSSFEWQVSDTAGNDLLEGNYGAGSGPGTEVSLFVSDEYRKKLAQGAHIQFSGYNLYHYEQLPGAWMSFTWPIFTVSAAILLLLLHHRGSGTERNLGWKLFGYSLISTMTFSVYGFPLPLGFVIALIFLRPPGVHLNLKFQAALVGLGLYVLHFFINYPLFFSIGGLS